MKIAHVSATFPPYYAGTGNVCFHNARVLAERGHDVTVYTTRLNGMETYQDTEYFTVNRLAYLLKIGNAAFLPDLLRLQRYDIVHLHYPFLLGAEIIWLKRLLRGQRYVLTYHNDLIWHGLKGVIFDLYRQVWTRPIFSSASRIIFTSWDFAQNNATIQPLIQKDQSKVVEVPNGVDASLFHPAIDPTPIQTRYKVNPQKQQVVMFAGAMDAAHHTKGGVPNLLKAIHQLNDPGVLLVLVGGGDMISAYADLANELGVNERTLFVGPVPHNNIPYYYSIADVVVLPSLLTEAFGMVIIEAMACGKPVIASNLPGLRSVVGNDGSGVLVEVGDVEGLATQIRCLLDDPQKRHQMGQRGRTKVETTYDWPLVVDRLEKVYQEVLYEE